VIVPGMELETIAVVGASAATFLGLGWTIYAGLRKDVRSQMEYLGHRVDRTQGDVTELERRQNDIKDDLHTNYAKVDQIQQLRAEMRQDFRQVFERLDQISQQMARYQGRTEGASRYRDQDD